MISYLLPDFDIIREAMRHGPPPRVVRVPLYPAPFGRLTPDEAEVRHTPARGWHVARFFNNGRVIVRRKYAP